MAPVVVHESNELSPESILVGFPENESITGEAIYTVALAETLPPVPVTVSVYVVDDVGETEVEPLVGTLPIPWFIDAELPPDDDHDNVEELPG